MLVTVIGGSGFVGSHTADKLSDAGHSVRVFDRVPSKWLRSDQTMIVGDILDENGLSNAIRDSEVVYHFAALANIDEMLDKPKQVINTNLLGTINVLEACHVCNVSRFVYASTVYVYSREGGFYRCSKQASENFIEEFQRRYGLEYTILRYGSLYGPRSDETNGLYNIVKYAIEFGRLRYNGTQEAMREYIHVEDAARASVAVLGDDFINESIVLTGQESMRVDDLLKSLGEILDIPGDVEFVNSDYPGHYVRTPYAYLPKLGKKYAASLHIDLGQGLLDLIDDIKHRKSD